MRHAVLSCVFLWSLVLGAPSLAHPGTFEPIDFPNAVITEAFGINGANEIVGTFFSGEGHGFLLDKDGTFQQIDVDLPGAASTIPLGINNAGEIVGYFLDTQKNHHHGFKRDKDRTFHQIDVPFDGATDTRATGINDAGEIVGFFEDDRFVHAFRRDKDRRFSQFDAPNSCQTIRAETFCSTVFAGINNAGDIVGVLDRTSPNQQDVHSFRLRGGGMFDLIDPPLTSTIRQSGARGINDVGQIVITGSFSKFPGNDHGFLRETDGEPDRFRYTQIDILGAVETEAFGINNCGTMVGATSLAENAMAL